MLHNTAACLTLIAMSAPALADIARPICAGTGQIVFSDTTGYFPSHVYTVPGSGSTEAAQVNVQNCGRTMSIDMGGRGLTMVPDVIGNGWTGQLLVDGYTMDFSLSHIGPTLLAGSTEILAEGGALRTDVVLRITDASAPAMGGCTDDAPEPLPARGTTLGHAALADALGDRMMPNDLQFSDFISGGQVASGGGTERVHVMLSGAGAILPLNLPELTLEELCAGETGLREPPREMLNFKITRFENTTTVFVQRIAVETGKITEQHETVARGEDQMAVASAIEQAIVALRQQPGDFSDGLP